MNPTIAYMDHPIGEPNGDDAMQYGDNLANAIEWAKFIVDVTAWAVHAPWYLSAIAIGKDSYGARRLAIDLALLERSDIYVATGGYFSPHMSDRIRRAKRLGIPIVDLTAMGVTPPAADEDFGRRMIRTAQKTITSRPRRVWMPLLTSSDLAALNDARHSLRCHMPDAHPAAVDIIDRIVGAATLDI